MKKGSSQMWWIIVAAILAIVVLGFLLGWFTSSGDRAFGGVDKTIDSLGDRDEDGVPDFIDTCPDDKNIGETLKEGETCGQARANS